MEYIYAALLLHKLEQKIDEDAVKKVITSTGAKPDDVKIKALVSALSEVDIEDALKNAATTVTKQLLLQQQQKHQLKQKQKKRKKKKMKRKTKKLWKD